MANIKIAQLTNQTTISDTDLVIVETATSTNKMTVGKLKELFLSDIKTPAISSFTSVPEISGVTTSPTYITAGLYNVSKLSNGDKVLDMQIFIAYPNLSGGIIGTLPLGYRPLIKISKIAYDFLNNQYIRIIIGVSGTIQLVSVAYGAPPAIGNGKISETIRFT